MKLTLPTHIEEIGRIVEANCGENAGGYIPPGRIPCFARP